MRNSLFRAPHYVYRIFNSRGQALYVGCSLYPAGRVMTHRSKSWGHEIHSYTVTEHVHRPAALAVERQEIARLNPLHNIVRPALR